MLIGFSLQNFRSFLREQYFSYSASSDRTHESTHCVRTGMKAIPKLSKSAIIFGPNGSGKTNFLVALRTLRELVLHSTVFSDVQFAERHTPFQFGPSVTQTSVFEIDILLNRVRYRYRVAYDAERIWSERLLVYKTGKSQRWFERNFNPATGSEEWAPFSPNFNGPRELWRKATRPRALFLTTAAQLNSEQLKPLTNWFSHCLQVMFPSDIADVNRMADMINDAPFKSRLLTFLRCIDIKVDDVRVVDADSTRSHVEFRHIRDGWPAVWLEPEYESAGVQRLLGLVGPLLGAIEAGRLLVIDEFDANLHPLVARFLISFINDPAVSGRNAQLMLVSHNTTLMDLDMLRRDEIWLAELDEYRASRLSTVLRSSPRKHEHIAKGYLRGRYGAVPVIAGQRRDLVAATIPRLSEKRAKTA